MASKYVLPPPRRYRLGYGWQRASRWCCLGTLVMLLWLLVPTARCSWHTFKDTPISELDEDSTSSAAADRERINQSKNFFRRWFISVSYCYQRTPLLGQEPWKEALFLLLAASTLVAWGAGRISARPG